MKHIQCQINRCAYRFCEIIQHYFRQISNCCVICSVHKMILSGSFSVSVPFMDSICKYIMCFLNADALFFGFQRDIYISPGKETLVFVIIVCKVILLDQIPSPSWSALNPCGGLGYGNLIALIYKGPSRPRKKENHLMKWKRWKSMRWFQWVLGELFLNLHLKNDDLEVERLMDNSLLPFILKQAMLQNSVFFIY